MTKDILDCTEFRLEYLSRIQCGPRFKDSSNQLRFKSFSKKSKLNKYPEYDGKLRNKIGNGLDLYTLFMKNSSKNHALFSWSSHKVNIGE